MREKDGMADMALVKDLNSATIFSFWARLVLEDCNDDPRPDEESEPWGRQWVDIHMTGGNTDHLDEPGLLDWMAMVKGQNSEYTIISSLGW
jgi:hypothetical protein